DDDYLTDRLVDETLRFIEANKEGPFLAYLSFYTIHTPIQACKRHLAHYKAKAAELPLIPPDHGRRREHDAWTDIREDNPALASMVHAMDENVGRLLDILNRSGLEKNTIVIFTSDNGGLTTKNSPGPNCELPLRAGKGWCYEGGIRVPLIVRVPNVTRPGTVSHEVVTSTDYFPTLLELIGHEGMPQQHVDGISITPALQGSPLDRELIGWHYPHYHGSNWRPGAALRAGKWKLIEFYDHDKVELYDLEKDLGEMTELSRVNPQKTRELLEKLHAWQKHVGAKMPVAR
ncbi:MAG: sulfatase-like hydrolase/transferase, partial [Planctomycetota bacterium]|nr:sulfatase-like hydrolase/transferase [Planctomycetota bacterium]